MRHACATPDTPQLRACQLSCRRCPEPKDMRMHTLCSYLVPTTYSFSQATPARRRRLRPPLRTNTHLPPTNTSAATHAIPECRTHNALPLRRSARWQRPPTQLRNTVPTKPGSALRSVPPSSQSCGLLAATSATMTYSLIDGSRSHAPEQPSGPEGLSICTKHVTNGPEQPFPLAPGTHPQPTAHVGPCSERLDVLACAVLKNVVDSDEAI